MGQSDCHTLAFNVSPCEMRLAISWGELNKGSYRRDHILTYFVVMTDNPFQRDSIEPISELFSPALMIRNSEPPSALH